jgi:hypothetical protein
MCERNWKEYNKALIRRGEILFSLEFLDTWNKELRSMNKGKRGRPFYYPVSFIMFLKVLHDILHIKYRQTEGFIRALSTYIPAIHAPSFSQIRRRAIKMELPLHTTLREGSGDFVIAVDSSGVKVANRGEWIRHKWKIRRGWIKVHIAVDVHTKEIVAIEITDEHTGDGRLLPPLVAHAHTSKGKAPATVLGDGAYDSKKNFAYLDARGIASGIKIRENASPKARGSPARTKYVRERKTLGYKAWRVKYGYGKRWMNETTFSRGKREFGEHVMATKWDNMVNEIKFQYTILNLLINGSSIYSTISH